MLGKRKRPDQVRIKWRIYREDSTGWELVRECNTETEMQGALSVERNMTKGKLRVDRITLVCTTILER
jgi:hypothetical protein